MPNRNVHQIHEYKKRQLHIPTHRALHCLLDQTIDLIASAAELILGHISENRVPAKFTNFTAGVGKLFCTADRFQPSIILRTGAQ